MTSALDEIYRELGRSAHPEGTAWTGGPQDFGDPCGEERAAREAAALFDLSGRSHLTFTGRDRTRFLHGFCTNDVKKLQPGQGCEAFVANIKGRIFDHIFLYADEEAIHVATTAGREEALFAHLDRYLIAEDVQIVRRSDELGELFVGGPQAAGRLETLLPGVDTLPENGHRPFDAGGAAGSIRRADLLRSPGYCLAAPRAGLPELWRRLTAAGVPPAGGRVFDALRIEAGLPLYGVDLTEDNLAQEAMRTARCISFTKGCYLGQEPIARLDALGHVNRQLAGVRLDSAAAPPHGAKVATPDGKDAGAITSSVVAPCSGHAIALGLLRSAACRPGAPLRVEIPGGTAAGEVFGW